MIDHLELIDLYKALIALGAGIILGLERELKDKSAGLKTITVICLGSALFNIISQKVGGQYTDSSRIASYIVSGIGFLGAGVIFRDGLNVSGLTTASVIWLSAAVGMAIGFGYVYLAAIFLAVALIVIYAGNYLNVLFPSGKMSKILSLTLRLNDFEKLDEINSELGTYVLRKEVKKIRQKDNHITMLIDITFEKNRLQELEDYLLKEKEIVEFDL